MREVGREEGRGTGLRYMPALDGLRALAVHRGAPVPRRRLAGREGGYLGVDAFFVLSRLPHHEPAARASGRRSGRHRPRGRSGAAGPAACSRRSSLVLAAVARVRGDRRACRTNSTSCGATRSRRSCYVANWNQIVSRPVVLRAVRGAVGACGTRGRSRSRSSSTWCGRSWCLGVLQWRRGSHRALFITCAVLATASTVLDGGALRARPRSVARVLRHRHARAVAADRRDARRARDALRRHRCAPVAHRVARRRDRRARRVAVDVDHDRRRRRLAVPRRVRARGRARHDRHRQRHAAGRHRAARRPLVVAAGAC